ncbi:general transcriptional corepressor trfA-like [Myzus persicae]|uniref:general transcriptional corepressor trfA-like n=1 Tax=Myzus persicae TaxID=13164 RepID=UPI000B937ADE|nr:general transcriptional corepressor trfA-like [Myzus persicae]
MECRRPVITGGVLRSPPSASAAPLTVAANPSVMRHRGRRHSRPYDYADNVVDEYNNNNNNSNVTAVTTINNTTQLMDELEQLRTDNFQLRLRVYNAERRVDRLSAAALERDRKRRSDNTDTDSDDTDASSDHAETDHNNAAAKATAEAAVRTIHDLLTVNRRLLALLAATVSAKAVSVSTDDKRRWQRLRNHIEEYAVDGRNCKEKTNEDDDEFHDASATDSETSCKARVVSEERSATRQKVLRSPPPPPQPPPSPPLETTRVDDEGAGSEVSRLRGRCRRLERSLQQLVNTELWARNRQIGKLEQQRYVTQVADAAAQKDRRPTEQAVVAAVAAQSQQHHLQQLRLKATPSNASPPATKGILVIRSAAEIPGCSTSKMSAAACTESQTAASSPKVATITTPPPVLPDYSEVNFFFSCDEEDDDDDDHDRREDSAETNCTSSSEEETTDSKDFRGDEQPVRLAAVGTPAVTSSTSKRKRHCRPHHRQPQQPIKSVGDSATVSTTTSSSTESAAAEDEADQLNGGSVMTTATATSPCTTRRHRTVSGGSGLHRRRRCRPPRRCSTCGRCSGGVDVAASDRPRPPSVADVQVQCGNGNVAVDHSCNSDRGVGELQLQQLRHELDARRRENGRLYDMLLRLQRGTRPGDRGKGDGGPRIPSPDFSDSDSNGSPEPYRRAAGVVRGHIADLLPPLLSMR